jgi:beta-xylosidase
LLDIRNLKSGAFAGLSAIGDQQNALTLAVSDGGHLVLSVLENDNSRIVTSVPVPESSSLQLRMTVRDGHLFRFHVSADGKNWIAVGKELDGGFLRPWDRSVRIALITEGPPGTNGRFGWMRIESQR